MFALLCRKMGAVGALMLGLAAMASPVEVWVGIPPQQTLVEAIGGESVTVSVLSGAGQSHETFAPSARQLRRLAGADVYFSMDLPFERALLGRLGGVMPDLRFVDTVAAVQRRTFGKKGACCDSAKEDDHGHGHSHAGGEDPHLWMSPAILRAQAEVIAATLVELLPSEEAVIRARVAKMVGQLEQLEADLEQALAPVRGQAFYINHPALGYFADAFGLVQVSLEAEGRQPSAARLRQLIHEGNAQGVRLVVAQPGFARSGAAVVADGLKVPLVVVDPLAADFFTEMRTLAQAFDGVSVVER